MKILVAEDDKVVSLLVCGILRERGHKTLSAYDQMQTIMFANKLPGPDAIILDLNMPGGTGGETLRRLKTSSRTEHIPVIVLSGTCEPHAPRLVAELGGESFLSKPVNREHLLYELDRVTADRPEPVAIRMPAGVARMAYE
ncbi:MAG TPA: response regulator [Gemmatimonadaceae bacterium]|nr:response regulator [Gemmatimonadaceae bacterium]